MNTVTNVAKCLMFMAIAFFFSVAGYSLLTGVQAIKATQTKINEVLDNSNTALLEINKPKTGVIAQTYEVLHDARLTLDNANKAAIDERLFLEKQQPLEIEKLNAILTTTNYSINKLSSNTSTVLHTVNDDALTLNETMNKATITLQSANELINNKNIPITLANIQATTASTAAITQDTQQAWHKYLHPSWPQKLWNGVTGAGISIAKFFW